MIKYNFLNDSRPCGLAAPAGMYADERLRKVWNCSGNDALERADNYQRGPDVTR